MIVEAGKDFHPTFSWDVGRPNIPDERSRLLWLRFVHFVEQCSFPIVVNSAYQMVRNFVMEPEGRYMGGAFSFTFWTTTQEDMDKFVAFVQVIYGHRIQLWLKR